jgi:hypothetical protein
LAKKIFSEVKYFVRKKEASLYFDGKIIGVKMWRDVPIFSYKLEQGG